MSERRSVSLVSSVDNQADCVVLHYVIRTKKIAPLYFKYESARRNQAGIDAAQSFSEEALDLVRWYVASSLFRKSKQLQFDLLADKDEHNG